MGGVICLKSLKSGIHPDAEFFKPGGLFGKGLFEDSIVMGTATPAMAYEQNLAGKIGNDQRFNGVRFFFQNSYRVAVEDLVDEQWAVPDHL